MTIYAAPLRLTYRSVDALIPYARNARTHSEAQVAQIAASIREFGWTNPVLVDGENGIIAGHGRLLAARKLGVAEVPVIELSGLTEAQKRAYIIADNKLALNAGWDEELLALEFGDLEALGFDLALTGFGSDEISTLSNLGVRGLTDPDEIPAPPEHATTLPGDVWLLGKHRLICGDSTKSKDVQRVLNGIKPHLLVSDPPYGVNYDPAWRERLGTGAELATGTVMNDDRADWREAWALFPGDVAYVWHGALHAGTVADSLEFRSARRSSGTRPAWSSAAATIIGSMSLPGMPSGRAGRATGRATASRPRFGRSRTASRCQATAPRSRSSA